MAFTNIFCSLGGRQPSWAVIIEDAAGGETTLPYGSKLLGLKNG